MLLLLFGTVCGSIVVQGDAALRIAEGLGVFQAGDATRVLWGLGPLDLSMIGIAACLLLPMSLLRHLRSLEVAALASVPAFAALVLVLAGDCVAWGFPGVRSGEVAWVVPNAGWAGVLEAIAIIGFADYCQPVLLPLLAEMPEGPVGLRTTKRAVDFTIFVFGTACYFSTAFFGAAAFGSRVRGNIVSNALLPSVAASVVLQGAILIYTSLTCIPIVIGQDGMAPSNERSCIGAGWQGSLSASPAALRTTIDALLFGKDGRGRGGPFSAASHFFKTAAIVGACLFVALIMKGHSEVVFSITGATGVCLICYVAPGEQAGGHVPSPQHRGLQRLPADSDSKPGPPTQPLCIFPCGIVTGCIRSQRGAHHAAASATRTGSCSTAPRRDVPACRLRRGPRGSSPPPPSVARRSRVGQVPRRRRGLATGASARRGRPSRWRSTCSCRARGRWARTAFRR